MKTDRQEDEGDNETFSNFTEILVYRKVPIISDCYYYMGIDRREKSCPGFVNNKGADQPAHPRSLISTFLFAY